jgi:tetratricopeptide (TPR) repeat protein
MIFELTDTAQQLVLIASELPHEHWIKIKLIEIFDQDDVSKIYGLSIQLFNRIDDQSFIPLRAALGMQIIALVPRQPYIEATRSGVEIESVKNFDDLLNSVRDALCNARLYRFALPLAKDLVEIWQIRESGNELKLAIQYDALATNYLELRQLQYAIDNAARAIHIYRCLIACGAKSLERLLAIALSNLGNALRRNQLIPDAVTAHKEARDIFRSLIANGLNIYKNDLAMALNNLGIAFTEQQALQESIVAFLESIEIRRSLISDGASFLQGDLAIVLTNMGTALSNQHRHSEALDAFQESKTIHKMLIKNDLNYDLTALAGVLCNIGAVLAECDQVSCGIESLIEAKEIFERLIESGDIHFEADLAVVLTNLGSAYQGELKLPASLVAYQGAQKIYQRLLKTGSTQVKLSLAEVQSAIDSIAGKQHSLPESKRHNKGTLSVIQRLVEDGAHHNEIDLAMALNNKAADLRRNKQFSEALQILDQAEKVIERLISSGATHFESNLVIVLTNRAAIFVDECRLEEGISTYEKTLLLLSKQSYPSPMAHLDTSAATLSISNIAWGLDSLASKRVRVSISNSIEYCFAALQNQMEFNPMYDPSNQLVLDSFRGTALIWSFLVLKNKWYDLAANVVCHSHSRILSQLRTIQLIDSKGSPQITATQSSFIAAFRELHKLDQAFLAEHARGLEVRIQGTFASKAIDAQQRDIQRRLLVSRLRVLKGDLVKEGMLPNLFGATPSLRKHRDKLAKNEALVVLSSYKPTASKRYLMYLCTCDTVVLIGWDQYNLAQDLVSYLNFESTQVRTVRATLTDQDQHGLLRSEFSQTVNSKFVEFSAHKAIALLSAALWSQLVPELESRNINSIKLITQGPFHDLPWLGTLPEEFACTIYPSLSMVPLRMPPSNPPESIPQSARVIQVLTNDGERINLPRLWFTSLEIKALEIIYKKANYIFEVIQYHHQIQQGAVLIAIGHGSHIDGHTKLLVGPDSAPALGYQELGAIGRAPMFLHASSCLAGRVSDKLAEPIGLPTLMGVAGTQQIVGSLLAIDDLYAVITSVMIHQQLIKGKSINAALKSTRTQLNSGQWDAQTIETLQAACKSELPQLLLELMHHLGRLMYNDDGQQAEEIKKTQNALDAWWPTPLVNRTDVELSINQFKEDPAKSVSIAFEQFLSTINAPDQRWIATITATFLVGLE